MLCSDPTIDDSERDEHPEQSRQATISEHPTAAGVLKTMCFFVRLKVTRAEESLPKLAGI